jgi:hypothetical protein
VLGDRGADDADVDVGDGDDDTGAGCDGEYDAACDHGARDALS